MNVQYDPSDTDCFKSTISGSKASELEAVEVQLVDAAEAVEVRPNRVET